MRRLGLFALILLPAIGAGYAVAQDAAPGTRAGNQIGQVLFGRQDDRAYYEGLYLGAQTRAAMESARLADAQNRTMEIEAKIRPILQRWWESAGFSPEESAAIAAAYHLDESEMPIVQRAKREGSKAAFAACATAYKDYNYLLANQLLIGAIVAQESERHPDIKKGADTP